MSGFTYDPITPPVGEGLTQKERIRAFLKQMVSEGIFHPVSYDATLGTHRVLTEESVSPAESIVNETQAAFGQPVRNRRYAHQEKLEWHWEMQLGFSSEVNLESFEDQLAAAALIIPRETTDEYDLLQVTLEAAQASYDHPPQQDPSVGTRAVYTFRARVMPG